MKIISILFLHLCGEKAVGTGFACGPNIYFRGVSHRKWKLCLENNCKEIASLYIKRPKAAHKMKCAFCGRFISLKVNEYVPKLGASKNHAPIPAVAEHLKEKHEEIWTFIKLREPIK